MMCLVEAPPMLPSGICRSPGRSPSARSGKKTIRTRAEEELERFWADFQHAAALTVRSMAAPTASRSDGGDVAALDADCLQAMASAAYARQVSERRASVDAARSAASGGDLGGACGGSFQETAAAAATLGASHGLAASCCAASRRGRPALGTMPSSVKVRRH